MNPFKSLQQVLDLREKVPKPSNLLMHNKDKVAFILLSNESGK